METVIDKDCGEFTILEENNEEIPPNKFKMKIGYGNQILDEAKNGYYQSITQKYVENAILALKEIIKSYGIFPVHFEPMEEFYILFHKTKGKPNLKMSDEKRNTVIVVINLDEGLYVGSKDEITFKTKITHELLHAISRFHMEEREIMSELYNHIHVILRDEYNINTIEQPQRFENELKKISAEIHKKGLTKDDESIFYGKFFQFAEQIRFRFYNMFIDAALGLIAMKFKLFEFMENTYYIDKKHIDYVKILIKI